MWMSKVYINIVLNNSQSTRYHTLFHMHPGMRSSCNHSMHQKSYSIFFCFYLLSHQIVFFLVMLLKLLWFKRNLHSPVVQIKIRATKVINGAVRQKWEFNTERVFRVFILRNICPSDSLQGQYVIEEEDETEIWIQSFSVLQSSRYRLEGSATGQFNRIHSLSIWHSHSWIRRTLKPHFL